MIEYSHGYLQYLASFAVYDFVGLGWEYLMKEVSRNSQIERSAQAVGLGGVIESQSCLSIYSEHRYAE